MTTLLQPGEAFLYMKVGVHANESLQDIIDRKRKEIEDAGVSFWGYGGNSCHPFTAVQPFVKQVTEQGAIVKLLMQEITSRHFAEGLAKEYSFDGKEYHPIPKGVKVLGSRYALVLRTLAEVDIDVPLSSTTVGVGAKAGTCGAQYIRGHVDKACLVYDPNASHAPVGNTVHMSLVAELAKPYAVVLR